VLGCRACNRNIEAHGQDPQGERTGLSAPNKCVQVVPLCSRDAIVSKCTEQEALKGGRDLLVDSSAEFVDLDIRKDFRCLASAMLKNQYVTSNALPGTYFPWHVGHQWG